MPLKKPTDSCLNGLLLIDKPADFSSHDIIAIVRRILRTKKIGHSGTLDPMATGLLILLVGRKATKCQPQFLTLDKTYQAVLKLGQQTDTWDRYGQPTSTAPIPPITPEKLTAAVNKLSGSISQQIPPFSAKKIKGQKMYELARKGIEQPPRFNQVTVQWNQYQQIASDEISFTLTGSSGTYARALGVMLAKELGTVGHLSVLRRIAVGPYSVATAFDGNLLKTCDSNLLQYQIKPL